MEVFRNMDEKISYKANPETRGTSPVQFFDDASGPPPAGTKARPRPPDRPREVPADEPSTPTTPPKPESEQSE